MLKQAAKTAAAIGVGVALGSAVLPRMLSPHLYDESFPPIWAQAAIHFAVVFAVCLLLNLLIQFVKKKL